jgi:hypothetical protein
MKGKIGIKKKIECEFQKKAQKCEENCKGFQTINSFMPRFSIYILNFVTYPNCRSSRRKIIQICYKPDMKLKKFEDPPIFKKSDNFGKQSWKLAKFGHCFVKNPFYR